MRLQAARRQRGLTQEELAFKINKTAESISNIERGIQLPSIETLARLSRARARHPIGRIFERYPRSETDARGPIADGNATARNCARLVEQ
jgi:transcriptional regulator with XRE-family HTH domain